MSWEVAEIVGICERRGFVKPAVYEGIYNLLDRTPEGELFPCLRKFGIRFSAYTVLAGGYLTGKHLPAPPAASAPAEDNHPFSHFNPGWCFSGFYSERYPPMAIAVTKLQGVVARHGLTLTEVAYRWLQWHSLMRPGDFGLIVGASTVPQLETALDDWYVQILQGGTSVWLTFGCTARRDPCRTTLSEHASRRGATCAASRRTIGLRGGYSIRWRRRTRRTSTDAGCCRHDVMGYSV